MNRINTSLLGTMVMATFLDRCVVLKIFAFMACLLLVIPGFSQTEQDDLEESLAYARNEIFARHGRPFTNPAYREYFAQFDWYSINNDYSDDLLTESDRRDIGILLRYERELPNLSMEDRSHLHEIVKTMRKYRYLSDEFISQKDVDIIGNGEVDLLKTSVKIIDGKVICDSQITSGHKAIWKESLINPYLGFGESDLFDPFESDIWVRFHIASKYAIPDLISFLDSGISHNMAIEMGMMDLEQSGYSISEMEYKDYLDKYKGKILEHGEPEGGRLLLIWYAPLGKFITFYSP